MNLISTIFVEPWPWWLGGIFIGLLVPAMYYFLNTALGVSSGFGNLVKLFVPKTKLKWLNTPAYARIFNWRFFFLAGIVIGAFISARTAGLSLVTPEMGLFTKTLPWPFALSALWFLSGGILLGVGARIAGGCTSGHSIHGLANFHLSSLLATVSFLIAGTITVYLLRLLVLGVI
ncbi:YeeE/YedE family protein [Dehalobacterium formicoaceticum]|uniref:YeeE/YedE family protein n=1 Tax=Dehalobacterium formicoaceticum TaxID=51515 RepID=UPI000B7D24BC|nr:YeeE/YedE thiosulfate transporter family protein [Dehalobacterium formicoaceticum]